MDCSYQLPLDCRESSRLRELRKIFVFLPGWQPQETAKRARICQSFPENLFGLRRVYSHRPTGYDVAMSVPENLKVNRLWAAQQYSSELIELYASMQDDFRANRRHSLSQTLRCVAEACQRSIWLVAFTTGESFETNQMPRDLNQLNRQLGQTTYKIGDNSVAEIAQTMEKIQNSDGQNLRQSTNDAIHSHVYFLWRMTRTADNYPVLVLQAARGLIQMATSILSSAFPQDPLLHQNVIMTTNWK